MQPEDIHIDDWYRILFGQVPLEFLIEVILRSVFIYLVILVSMRMLGKRMAGQLSRNDMIALTTLAASIGVPWQAPDRGLLPALIIASIVVAIGRIISRWSSRNMKIEAAMQDTLSILVKDSVMQLSVMKKTKITRERLFAYLRSQHIVHLGSVKRIYLEAGGFFTLIKSTSPVPGLIVLPGWDTEFIERQKFSDTVQVCTRCGNKRIDKEEHCGKCKNDKWVNGAMI